MMRQCRRAEWPGAPPSEAPPIAAAAPCYKQLIGVPGTPAGVLLPWPCLGRVSSAFLCCAWRAHGAVHPQPDALVSPARPGKRAGELTWDAPAAPAPPRPGPPAPASSCWQCKSSEQAGPSPPCGGAAHSRAEPPLPPPTRRPCAGHHGAARGPQAAAQPADAAGEQGTGRGWICGRCARLPPYACKPLCHRHVPLFPPTCRNHSAAHT